VRRKSNRFLLQNLYGFSPAPQVIMDLKFPINRTTSAFAMKTQYLAMQSAATVPRHRYGHLVPLIAFTFLALPSSARASIFHGETLDNIANVISWVAIVIA